MSILRIKSSFFILIASALICLLGFIFYLQQKKYVDLLIWNEPSELVFKRCTEAMKNDLCTIMGANSSISDQVKEIYLPKYGPLDANIYRKLLRAGPGMCQLIKESCTEDIQSSVCKLGTSLY